MLFAGEYVDLDSNLNFVRRVNNIMGYNFKGIDYRATCTATSFGTLCRNTAATHNTTYRTINLSNMKLQNIFIDVPTDATISNTITFPSSLTSGISTIFV